GLVNCCLTALQLPCAVIRTAMDSTIAPSKFTDRAPRHLGRRRAIPVRSYSFPKTFAWGAATAAAQIEGAAFEDGKGESIWDRFARARKIDAPTIACDHYHHYREDVALLRQLGVGNYRFSVAWPRIIPRGD